MFWHSVGAGLELFLDWEIWLGALLYAAAVSASVAWIQTTVRETEEGRKAQAGCFARAVCGPLLQGILVSGLLTLLHPLLLRGGGVETAGLVSRAGPVVIAGLAAGGVGALIALLPVLRGLMKSSYAATLFVQGAIAFRVLVVSGNVTPGANPEVLRYPGPVETLAYFFIALVFGAVLGMSAVLLRMQTGAYPVKNSEGQFQADVVRKEWAMILVLMPFLQVLAGWAALMMYLQWVRLAHSSHL